MGYYITLTDPVSRQTLHLDHPHLMRGSTYALGGATEASLNVTYNYGKHLYRILGDEGIRCIYGKSGAESLPTLDAAISQLSDDVSDNYWDATEGNTKRALVQLRALASMRPDGVWEGD